MQIGIGIGIGIGAAWGVRTTVTYLLGPFVFATAEAAPMASPHTETGAVGSLTVTDTAPIFSVAGGKLAYNAGVSGFVVSPTALARVAGRAVLATVQRTTMGPDGATAGWGSATTNVGRHHVSLKSAGAIVCRTAGGGADLIGESWPTGADIDLACVLRTAGAFFLARVPGANALYTLYWVDVSLTGPTLYPGFSNADDVGNADNLRVADLGGSWATDYGIATDRKATSANGDTIAHTADCIIEHTITAATGVSQELWVRRVDANNGWIVRMDQAGSTIALIEKVAGVETSRSIAAQTWTNGVTYRVLVTAEGAAIKTYVANAPKNSYDGATNFQEATGGYASHAGTDLLGWPRKLAVPNGV